MDLEPLLGVDQGTPLKKKSPLKMLRKYVWQKLGFSAKHKRMHAEQHQESHVVSNEEREGDNKDEEVEQREAGELTATEDVMVTRSRLGTQEEWSIGCEREVRTREMVTLVRETDEKDNWEKQQRPRLVEERHGQATFLRDVPREWQGQALYPSMEAYQTQLFGELQREELCQTPAQREEEVAAEMEPNTDRVDDTLSAQETDPGLPGEEALSPEMDENTNTRFTEGLSASGEFCGAFCRFPRVEDIVNSTEEKKLYWDESHVRLHHEQDHIETQQVKDHGEEESSRFQYVDMVSYIASEIFAQLMETDEETEMDTETVNHVETQEDTAMDESLETKDYTASGATDRTRKKRRAAEAPINVYGERTAAEYKLERETTPRKRKGRDKRGSSQGQQASTQRPRPA